MTPLTDAAQLLTEAGLPTTVTPGDVRLPGGWLTLDRIERANVAGEHRLVCSLFLVTGDDGNSVRVGNKLLELLTTALGVLTPDGPVTTTRVVFEPDPTNLPALRVPIHL